MRFKVGDKVKVRKDLKLGYDYGGDTFVEDMVTFEVVTIINVLEDGYTVEENGWHYTDAMLGCLVGEPFPKFAEAIRNFSTGAVRDTAEGKPRMGLLPLDLLRRVAMHYTKGADKYEADNWRLGQPKDTTMDSLLRHLYAYRAGMDDEDHLSAVIWNALSMMHVDENLLDTNPELDFAYKYESEGK